MNGRLANHRWLRLLLPAAAFLLLGGYIGCVLVGSLFRAKLTATVKRSLGADLVMGSVIYRPPYTFLARDVRLLRRDAAGTYFEVLRAEGLDVTLDGFSNDAGSTPIRRIVLNQPTAYLAHGGVPIGVEQLQLDLHPSGPRTYGCDLAIKDAAISGRALGTLDVSAGICEVTNVSLNGGVCAVADSVPCSARTKQEITNAALAGDISLTGAGSLHLKDFRRSTYQFTLDVADAAARVTPWRRPLDHGNGRILVRSGSPTADASGWLAVESSIDHFDLSAGTARIRLGGGKFTAFPTDHTWRLAEVVGSIELGKELPIELEQSTWFFEKHEFRGPLEFTLAARGPFRVPPGKSAFDTFEHELLAYPHGISMKPRSFAQPIEKITGGPIAFRGGVITLANLTGSYGPDKLLLRSARLTLEDAMRGIKLDDLRRQVKFEEIAGTVVFGRPGLPYPSTIGKTIRQLRPTGPFVVGGGSWYAVNRVSNDKSGRKPKPDFLIRLIGDGGSFLVTGYDIPLTDIHGQATLTPLVVDIAHFESKAMGGTTWAVGQILPGRPMLYQGNVQLRNTDLRQLAATLSLQEPARSKLSGVGCMNVKLTGAGKGGKHTPAETLTADGELEILGGDFWSVPAVREVASQVRSATQPGDGDAAAVFHIADQTITLKNAAVNSPVLGLEGTGTIGFDKSISLTIVAAPLGDWRDKMRQAKIPVVGDILGAVQKLVNSVQGVLFYQFRISGSLAHPVKTVIPAPVISDPMALLFGQMLRQDRNGQLLNDVKGPASRPSSPQPASAR